MAAILLLIKVICNNIFKTSISHLQAYLSAFSIIQDQIKLVPLISELTTNHETNIQSDYLSLKHMRC